MVLLNSSAMTFIIFFHTFLSIGLVFPINSNVTGNDEWELIIHSDDISVYERWVTGNKGCKVRQRKGEMEVNGNIGQVTDIITKDEKIKLWMSGVENAYTLKRINPDEWYSYILFNLPWPLDNRDLITYCIKEQNVNMVTIKLLSKENYIPPCDGIIRMTDYYGSWQIEKRTDNKVKIVFIAQSDIPPVFPRFIQDPVIRNTFLNTLKNLKDLINS